MLFRSTTFAALELLGPNYTWKTSAWSSAPLQGDTLAGDLILKGGADPKFTFEHLEALLRDLRARGVREIRGELVLDRSLFAGVEAGDAGSFDNEPSRPYNTQPDALLVNFKSIRLNFIPDGSRRAVNIVAEPALPQVQIVNNLALSNEPCGDWVEKLKVGVTGDATTARLSFAGNFPLACGEKERQIGRAHV